MARSKPGSPPHLRGKHQRLYSHPLDARITPAPAGKTCGRHNKWWCRWDHPRTCGENSVTKSLKRNFAGSPPHLRGKLTHIFQLKMAMRITPAPAGKTSLACLKISAFKDHPRTCGENSKKRVALSIASGSPPHLRGKHLTSIFLHTTTGITPAPAGKTSTFAKISFPV